MESDYLETMLSMPEVELARVPSSELAKLVIHLADLRYDGLTGLMTRTSFLKGLKK